MADLRSSETDAKDAVVPWLKFDNHGQRVGFIELPLNARDQSAGNAMGIMGSIEGGEDILDDGCDGHSPAQMRLRANEDLSVTDILMCRPRQIGLGHLVEIVTSLQHCEAKVIEVEERLQVVERVSAAQRRCIGIWQSHAVSLRQGEQHFGLERALQMHVQLRLRQRGDECGNFGHGLALSLDWPLCTRLSLGQTEQGLLLRANRRQVVQATAGQNKLRLVKPLFSGGRHFLVGAQLAWPLLKTFSAYGFFRLQSA